MKANELRIGNYYQENWIDGDIAQITPNDIQDLIDDPIDDFFYPIKINDDWLIRLGFYVWVGEYWWKHPDNCFELHPSEDGYYLSINLNEYITGEPIHYVHQLQNLYFSLYQKELTIKPQTK
jgi:hypothetical protein